MVRGYDSFIRISYGPSFKEVQRGLEGMQRVIERGLVLKRQAHIHGKPFGKTGEPWADR